MGESKSEIAETTPHGGSALDYSADLSPTTARSETSVCLASLRFHPEFSGAATRFRRYAPGLGERGVRLSVFTASNSGSGSPAALAKIGGLHAPESVDDIPVQRVTVGSDGYRATVTFTRALVAHCLRARPKVVQFLQLWPYSPLWLMRLRAAGIPLVFGATMFRPDDLEPWKVMLSRMPLRFMDCVVVSSEEMRDQLRQDGVRRRFEVIPHGVDLDRFSPATAEQKAAIRRRLGVDPDAEVILYVGSIKARKGVDLLAEAWLEISRRPRAHLVLVGPLVNAREPEAPQRVFLESLRRKIDSSGSSQRVTFTDSVTNVEDFFKAADVFVFPSKREGMPNAVLEAFACGVPSVMTHFAGLSTELGTPGREYIRVERSTSEMVSAVVGLLDSTDLRARLSRAGRVQAERRLGLGTTLDRYASLYKELASGRARLIPE